ncbi:unnamed protein product [Brachionus calyciflorus]|uniref:Homocysteine-responsive endoplasmic reticulum-resident ubiquitin-like domain member 2 protein n=1 Tax=Brachionus calyciflorus TaxID=104777 RepID=A0A813PR86_9BILA|nr:unnamed protein product [Brachionus calyciflorus]
MSTSSESVKLIIKAANHKFEDFIIENCQLNWTVKDIKEHLSSNYPKNPNPSAIRLIYSVHSANSPRTVVERNVDENETDVDTEMTPGSSSGSESMSSSATSSPSFTPTSTPATDRLNSNSFINSQTNQTYENLSPKQQYELMLKSITNYYNSMGIPVENNSWYSCYVQQMALYNHMYMNYINSMLQLNIQSQPTTESVRSAETPAQFGQTQPVPEPQPEPRPAQPQRAPQNQANNNDGDREDDWLGMLHNFVSFLIFLSIVYYYSSFERFLVIFVVAVILICYHKGWLQIQRRRVNQPQQNTEPRRAQRGNQGENDGENNQNEEGTENRSDQQNEQQQQQPPTTMRLVFIFILKFFTSLIPERPRAVN